MVKTGGVQMIPIDGGYHVWTKKVGTGDRKVLLLHGGPGATHEYMECFEDFLPQANIQFYYYDQLGSHYSDQPDDPSLWKVDRFVTELEQVRQGLGLDQFFLYGQSWGAMLAMEYAFSFQQHLRGLILSNMTGSIQDYVRYLNHLRSKLPQEIIAKLDFYEAKEDYEAPEYQSIMFDQIYRLHLCRLDQWPEPFERSFGHLNAQVYNTMQGPNEFVVKGNFKDWNAWSRLPSIQVPTLVMGARYDTMDPEEISKMAGLIPGADLFISDKGSHLTMYDDQEVYFDQLISFIKRH